MRKINSIRQLEVFLAWTTSHQEFVGTLALDSQKKIGFEFSPEFIGKRQAQISPFKLDQKTGVQVATTQRTSFDGLFGVFADSLPDGWGMLLMELAFRQIGYSLAKSSPLDRLYFIGQKAMGALEYKPCFEETEDIKKFVDLANLNQESQRVISGNSASVLQELIILGGSPGGARPKITVFIEGNKIENGFYKGDLFSAIDHNSNQSHENWIIKFRSSTDTEKDSLSEYVYSLVAKKVGIVIEPTALFDDKKNGIWFGMKRFDRGDAGEKIHMHTLAGLLHADHRSPSMDYESVLKATFALTRSIEEVENIFRIAVFNGEFHNRDDHTKNFSFLMTSDRKWKVSPAYDLTYSTGMGGEHATSFAGEGKNPQKVDYLKVAISGGIQKKHALEIIDEVCAGKEFLRDKCKEFGLKELWKVFDAK